MINTFSSQNTRVAVAAGFTKENGQSKTAIDGEYNSCDPILTRTLHPVQMVLQNLKVEMWSLFLTVDDTQQL